MFENLLRINGNWLPMKSILLQIYMWQEALTQNLGDWNLHQLTCFQNITRMSNRQLCVLLENWIRFPFPKLVSRKATTTFRQFLIAKFMSPNSLSSVELIQERTIMGTWGKLIKCSFIRPDSLPLMKDTVFNILCPIYSVVLRILLFHS